MIVNVENCICFCLHAGVCVCVCVCVCVRVCKERIRPDQYWHFLKVLQHVLHPTWKQNVQRHGRGLALSVTNFGTMAQDQGTD